MCDNSQQLNKKYILGNVLNVRPLQIHILTIEYSTDKFYYSIKICSNPSNIVSNVRAERKNMLSHRMMYIFVRLSDVLHMVI